MLGELLLGGGFRFILPIFMHTIQIFTHLSRFRQSTNLLGDFFSTRSVVVLMVGVLGRVHVDLLPRDAGHFGLGLGLLLVLLEF